MWFKYESTHNAGKIYIMLLDNDDCIALLCTQHFNVVVDSSFNRYNILYSI